MGSFTIRDLAQQFGVTLRTIRFYEDRGLLNPVRNGKNRAYSKRDRARLRLALRARRLGLTIAEIKDLFELYDAAKGGERAEISKILEVLTARKAELEQKREDVEVMLAEILAFEAQCQQLLKRRPDHHYVSVK
jgi:DNA-binding transcriptional MerR regulator